MHLRKTTIATAVAIALPASSVAAAPAIDGRWLTADGAAVVVIGGCGPELCGRVLRVTDKAPKGPLTDRNNPDPALRARPIVGLPILTGLAADGDRWRGRVYSPEEGRTYRAVLTRNPDGTLGMRGCVLMFCRGETWRRAR